MTSSTWRIALRVLGALLLPLALIYVAVYILWRQVWGIVLRLWFRFAHARHGRRALFVYSESPNWHEYIEKHILPRIRDRAVVLNWSERGRWQETRPWEARFYRHFAGDREFNPMALVFDPGGRIQPVRFHAAFMKAKRGNEAPLERAEATLYRLLGLES